jgi:metal-sulfur cluster biosynthetic enzyme
VNESSLEEDVKLALTKVTDPETGLSIMRMDLIHDLTVSPDGEVSLVFRPSSPVCPMAYSLGNAIRKCLADISRVKSVNIGVRNFEGAERLESLLKSASRKET